MSAITVIREGAGPEVLLVHGGGGPRRTWQGIEPLARSWTLAYAYRRGYPPSPPGRHDFDVDADDLAPLLATKPHVVAHSYGALGSLLAAARSPEQVRSLTVIEPPLYYLAPDDPEVEHLERLGDAFLQDGLDTDPAMLREFLRLAGSPTLSEGPLPDAVVRSVQRAHGGRRPGEARPRLDVLRVARIPSLVVSGAHAPAIEHICDALAVALDGERAVISGAGHFVAAAPGFAEKLDRFLRSTP